VSKQNEILVFEEGSKRKDYTIRSVFIADGVKKLRETLGEEEGRKACIAFRNLKRMGAESMVFRHNGRKIKVQLAA
jgi:hypothetical protein